jgi:hypothetical protein
VQGRISADGEQNKKDGEIGKDKQEIHVEKRVDFPTGQFEEIDKGGIVQHLGFIRRDFLPFFSDPVKECGALISVPIVVVDIPSHLYIRLKGVLSH